METEKVEKPKLDLSSRQIAASALAAVSSSIAASTLGVAGTLIGAAVASATSVVAASLYNFSLDRTAHQVRTVRVVRPGVPATRDGLPGEPTQVIPLAQPTGASEAPTTTLAPVPGSPSEAPRRRMRSVAMLAAASVAIFAVAITAISVLELGMGRSVSTAITGEENGRTSIGAVVRDRSATPTEDTRPAGEQPAEEREATPGAPESEPTGEAEPSPGSTSAPTPDDDPTGAPSGEPAPDADAPPAPMPTAAPEPTVAPDEPAPSEPSAPGEPAPAP